MMGEHTLIEAEESSLWSQCLSALKSQISESALNTWFSALEIVESSAGEMVIGVPNGFVLEYVSHHYRGIIEKTLEDILRSPVRISFSVLSRAPHLEVYQSDFRSGEGRSEMSSYNGAGAAPGQDAPWLKSRGPVRIEVTVPLNTRYTFDDFVIGDCNQLAHAACMAVAEAPSHNNFNPLVLYGGTGMGKTHLVQAIAHFCIENETVRKVVYRTSEEFTREYIEFVQKNKDSRTFYQVYKDADILLIDDIQFLAGKQSTQDEFFNIFSILQSLNKQIVITSDRPPSEIKGLHTRLLSRFDTGLLADLQPPNLETRLAILQKKSEGDGDSCITGDVLTYVANQVTSNIRELEGTLIKLSAYASFTHMPITVEIAKQILGDTLRNVNQPVTIKRVLDQVAMEYSTTVSLLTSQTRKKNVAEPRQIAMYMARQLTDNSLHTIGLAFGRDYSTVIHSIKKVEQCMEKDPDLKKQVDRLMESLG
ncbi:MAG: Chromosomal replication initiator protein DnaA [Fibrobacteres bacterium]|nr:Chromosomal replication initiator protein DnaA [Fibrobacterota bacterium]